MSSSAGTTDKRNERKTSGISPSLRIGSFCLNDFKGHGEPHRGIAANVLFEMLRRFDLLLLMEARAENSRTNIDLLIRRLDILDKDGQFDFEEDEAICLVHGREHYCFFYRVSRLTVLDTMYPTENEVVESWEEKQKKKSKEGDAFSLDKPSGSLEKECIASTMFVDENKASGSLTPDKKDYSRWPLSEENVTRRPNEGQTNLSASGNPIKIESLVIESLISTSSSHESDVFSLTALKSAVSQDEDPENTPDVVKNVKYGVQRAHSLAKSVLEYIPKPSNKEQKETDTGKNEGENENENEDENDEDEDAEEDENANQSMNLETQKSSSDSEDYQKGMEGGGENTIKYLHDVMSEERKNPYGSKCSIGLACSISGNTSTTADSSLEGQGTHESLTQDSPATDQLQASTDESFSTIMTSYPPAYSRSSIRLIREGRKGTLPMVVIFKGEPAPRMVEEPRFNVMEIVESLKMANTPASSSLSFLSNVSDGESVLPITVEFPRRKGYCMAVHFTDSGQEQSATRVAESNAPSADANEAYNGVASGSVVFDQKQAVHKGVQMAVQSPDDTQEQDASFLKTSDHRKSISKNNVDPEKAAPVGEFGEGRGSARQTNAGEPPTPGKERISDTMDIQKVLRTPEVVSSAPAGGASLLSSTDEVTSLYGTGDVTSCSDDVLLLDRTVEVVSLSRDNEVAGSANVQRGPDPKPGSSMAPDQEEAAPSKSDDGSLRRSGLGKGSRQPVNDARRRDKREKKHPIVFLREPFVVRFSAPSLAISEFIAVALHTNPNELSFEDLRINQLYECIRDKWHSPDVLFMGDIHVEKMTHLKPDCWRLLQKNAERLVVKVAQVLANTLQSWLPNSSVERMLLTGKALVSSFCEGSDSIFWYDDELGFSEEECLEIMSIRFPMQIKLWGAVLPPQISGVKVHTSLKVEQMTLVTSKSSIYKFHRANGRLIGGFRITMLVGGGLRLVKATKYNVLDVERCLSDFQLVFPDILRSSTISTVSSLMATPITSNQLSPVYRSRNLENNNVLYIVSVLLSLKKPHTCYVIVNREVN